MDAWRIVAVVVLLVAAFGLSAWPSADDLLGAEAEAACLLAQAALEVDVQPPPRPPAPEPDPEPDGDSGEADPEPAPRSTGGCVGGACGPTYRVGPVRRFFWRWR